MDTSSKLKRCSVKLNRLSFIGSGNPDEIQDQILDQRIRRCSVRLQRMTKSEMQVLSAKTAATLNGYIMKRCCIRLPRLNIARSGTPTDKADSENEDLRLD